MELLRNRRQKKTQGRNLDFGAGASSVMCSVHIPLRLRADSRHLMLELGKALVARVIHLEL